MRFDQSIALLLGLCAGCHSLTQLRVRQEVVCAEQRVVLGVWFLGRAHPVTGGDAPAVEAVTSVILYPVDVLASLAVAVRAPFDPRLDITWGPVGALAGICLPWVTLVPHLYPPSCLLEAAPRVELRAAEFEELRARTRAGDGLRAYRELVAPGSWACGREAMTAVELLEYSPNR